MNAGHEVEVMLNDGHMLYFSNSNVDISEYECFVTIHDAAGQHFTMFNADQVAYVKMTGPVA